RCVARTQQLPASLLRPFRREWGVAFRSGGFEAGGPGASRLDTEEFRSGLVEYGPFGNLEHPMPRRLIDLSVTLRDDVATDPEGHGPQIEYLDHRDTVGDLARFFPGLQPDQLPDGEGWAVERLRLSTHNGTHLDAPWHYASTMNGGERAITIDEVPLEWCFSAGVKLDFRHFDDGYVVTAADVETELRRIGHELKPLDIVLVNTRAGSRYGEDDYIH